MPFRRIVSTDVRYLAATDILIGDMSDINYEFLLFDRPVILLANEWLRQNFPDIGTKTDLDGLEDAIRRSIENPCEYREQRQHWLKKTMHLPDGNSSKRVLGAILERASISNPALVFIHNGNSVRRSTLLPLYEEARNAGFEVSEAAHGPVNGASDALVCVAAHNHDLMFHGGFKVHVDHGLKGVGVSVFDRQVEAYRANHHFPTVHLHVTEGETSFEKTRILVGPHADRVIMVGYPRSDYLLRLNTQQNRTSVCDELRFDRGKPVVTYAPVGPKSFEKPGGSLSNEVLQTLRDIGTRTGYNVLAKLKYASPPLPVRWLARARSLILILKSACSSATLR